MPAQFPADYYTEVPEGEGVEDLLQQLKDNWRFEKIEEKGQFFFILSHINKGSNPSEDIHGPTFVTFVKHRITEQSLSQKEVYVIVEVSGNHPEDEEYYKNKAITVPVAVQSSQGGQMIHFGLSLKGGSLKGVQFNSNGDDRQHVFENRLMQFSDIELINCDFSGMTMRQVVCRHAVFRNCKFSGVTWGHWDLDPLTQFMNPKFDKTEFDVSLESLSTCLTKKT